jgi:hypothetical protein
LKTENNRNYYQVEFLNLLAIYSERKIYSRTIKDINNNDKIDFYYVDKFSIEITEIIRNNDDIQIIGLIDNPLDENINNIFFDTQKKNDDGILEDTLIIDLKNYVYLNKVDNNRYLYKFTGKALKYSEKMIKYLSIILFSKLEIVEYQNYYGYLKNDQVIIYNNNPYIYSKFEYIDKVFIGNQEIQIKVKNIEKLFFGYYQLILKIQLPGEVDDGIINNDKIFYPDGNYWLNLIYSNDKGENQISLTSLLNEIPFPFNINVLERVNNNQYQVYSYQNLITLNNSDLKIKQPYKEAIISLQLNDILTFRFEPKIIKKNINNNQIITEKYLKYKKNFIYKLIKGVRLNLDEFIIEAQTNEMIEIYNTLFNNNDGDINRLIGNNDYLLNNTLTKESEIIYLPLRMFKYQDNQFLPLLKDSKYIMDIFVGNIKDVIDYSSDYKLIIDNSFNIELLISHYYVENKIKDYNLLYQQSVIIDKTIINQIEYPIKITI